MNPLVSIIIPTRERADTLKHALQTVTAQTYQNLEIIVSDNASSPATREVVDAASDPRIRYINTGRRVSMTDNYEFALSHVTGDWISVIGDDDGILPSGIERALRILDQSGQHVLSSTLAYYEWPGVSENRYDGYLRYPLGRGFKVIESQQRIRDLLNGRLHQSGSPMFYTGGLIHKSIYEQLATRSERVLRSTIPDVYSLFAICSICDKFVQSLEPLMILGNSSHSIGANPTGPTSALFFTESPMPWHPTIADPPNRLMRRAIWLYESFLQSEFLRQGRPIPIDPAGQFRLAAAEIFSPDMPKEDLTAFWDWKTRFWEMHKLQNKKTSLPLGRRIADLIHKRVTYAKGALDNYRLYGDDIIPLKNVFDAAIAAQDINDNPPSRFRNIAGVVRRRFHRSADS